MWKQERKKNLYRTSISTCWQARRREASVRTNQTSSALRSPSLMMPRSSFPKRQAGTGTKRVTARWTWAQLTLPGSQSTKSSRTPSLCLRIAEKTPLQCTPKPCWTEEKRMQPKSWTAQCSGSLGTRASRQRSSRSTKEWSNLTSAQPSFDY